MIFVAEPTFAQFMQPVAPIQAIDVVTTLDRLPTLEQRSLWRDIVDRLVPAQRSILEEELQRRWAYLDRA
jgi:hypothetical protein